MAYLLEHPGESHNIHVVMWLKNRSSPGVLHGRREKQRKLWKMALSCSIILLCVCKTFFFRFHANHSKLYFR
jgi:hypothetical protein